MWDDNLKKVADHVYEETGKRVTFVQGPIEIKKGSMKRFTRGVNMEDGIIIRMNDPKATPEQISLHEIFHDFSAASPMLNEAIKEAVIDKYSPEAFEKVFEAYADKLAGVYELEDASEESYKALEDAIIEEIFADAYANINSFGAFPTQFRETVLKIVNEESQRLEAGKKKAAEAENNSGGKESYSFSDVTIPTYEELIAKDDMEIVDITKSYGKGRYKEQRTEFINSEEAKAILREPVVNKDTGESIFIVNSTFTHSFSNADLGAEQIAAIKNIRKIIENAVLTHAEVPTHGNESTTGVYTLFAAVKTKTGIKPTKLKIKEYRLDGNRLPQNIQQYFDNFGEKNPYASVYDNRVLVLEEDGMTTAETKKEEPSSSAVPRNSKSAVTGDYPSGSSVISIADLLSLVNSEYQKYIPKKKEGFDKFSIDDIEGADKESADLIRREISLAQSKENLRRYEEDEKRRNRQKTGQNKLSPEQMNAPAKSRSDLKKILYKIR